MLVDIGGHSISCRLLGEGRPAVVFEHGGAFDKEYWGPVATEVAALTRVAYYDRAGIGESEPGPLPRSGERLNEELRALLRGVGVTGPVILVGHAYGGVLARLVAVRFPDEVAGLVLVDAAHENHNRAFRERLTGEEARKFDEAREALLTSGPPGLRAEFEAIEATFEQARRCGPLPRVPLTVLTAGALESPALGESAARLFYSLWVEHQRRLANLAPGGRHIVVEGSGHCIHQDRPKVVVAVIEEMLNEVRSEL